MVNRCSKIVVVGDGMVGKTALLSAFVNNNFQDDYIPTVFDTTSKDIELVGNRVVSLGLWDTGGQEEFDQIRQLAYPGASLILLCYSIDSQTSLDNVEHLWVGEVTACCPGVPTVLVGCKCDRRFQPPVNSRRPDRYYPALVDPKHAQQVSKRIGAYVHIECSALTRSNIDAVFEISAWIIAEREDHLKAKPSKIKRMLSFTRDKSSVNGSVCRSCNSDQTEQRSRTKPTFWCYGRQ